MYIFFLSIPLTSLKLGQTKHFSCQKKIYLSSTNLLVKDANFEYREYIET